MAGKYYDELAIGMVFKHEVGRTLTETDNVLFNALTMNPQPLHINEDFAGRAPDLGALETGKPEIKYGPRWLTWQPFYR